MKTLEIKQMLKFKSKLIVAVMLVFGVTAFMSCEKKVEKSEENLNEVLMSDANISKLASMHNVFLERIITNYNYSLENNKIDNFKQSFLKAELDGISSFQKTEIIGNLKKPLNKDNGEPQLSSMTADDLIQKINSSNFSNKALMNVMVSNAAEKVLNNKLSCEELNIYLDGLLEDAVEVVGENELIILKTYFETLKASAYFWFPEDLGGSGTGFAHLQELNGNFKADLGPLGSALVADAASISIGMIGVAVVGTLAGPVGWLSLLVVAGESAANSGLAAAISAM